MFCNTPEIEIHNIPDDVENVEEYIFTTLGYNTSELSWRTYHTDDEITIRLCYSIYIINKFSVKYLRR